MLNDVQLKKGLKANDEKFIKTLSIKLYKDDKTIKLTADLCNYKKKLENKGEITINYFY